MRMARQQNFAEDGDLFKKLPESIVHHILYFLGLKDYSRLSCVSRRYRELCVSTPWVTLNNTNLNPRRFLFNNFVDRLLCRRSWHGVKIQDFILKWDFGEFFENEAYRIDTWFYHVVNLGVQKISIQLTTTRFALPQCVLNCKTMVFDQGWHSQITLYIVSSWLWYQYYAPDISFNFCSNRRHQLFWRMAFTIQVP